MNRRHLLGAILGAAAAPAIARSGSLMRIWTPPHVIWLDGEHDDTAALQAHFDGQRVRDLRTGLLLPRGWYSIPGAVRLSGTLRLPAADVHFEMVRAYSDAPINIIGSGYDVAIDTAVVRETEAPAAFICETWAYGGRSRAALNDSVQRLDDSPRAALAITTRDSL